MKITQSQLELLFEMKDQNSKDPNVFVVRKKDDPLIQLSETQGLIQTRPKGRSKTNVEVAFTELGWGVVSATVEHEVVSDEKPVEFAETSQDVGIANEENVGVTEPQVETTEHHNEVDVSAVEESEKINSSNYEIFNDIPMPKFTRTRKGHRSANTYPLDSMNVGECIKVKYREDVAIDKELRRIRQNVSITNRRYNKGKNYKFRVFPQDDRTCLVFRVA